MWINHLFCKMYEQDYVTFGIQARLFNANQPNPRKCIQILTRILCLLNKVVLIIAIDIIP